jgi:hypothetical protein
MDILYLDTISYYYITGSFFIFLWLVARFFHLRRTVLETIEKDRKIVLKIAIPRNNDKTPLSAEQLFSSLHGIVKGNPKSKCLYSFEIVAGSYGIHFLAVVDSRYKKFVENQIFAQYPEAEITEVADFIVTFEKQPKKTVSAELTLSKELFLPIRTFPNFQVDPLAAICGAVSKLQKEEEVWIQIVVRPVGNIWQSAGKGFVDSRKQKTDSEGRKVALESGESAEMSETERKNTKVGFQFIIRILSRAEDSDIALHNLEDTVASFRQFQTPHLNSLAVKSQSKNIFTYLRYLILGRRLDDKLSVEHKFLRRFLCERENKILNIEELASVFHLPNKTVEAPNIAWAMSKKLEYPLNLPGNQVGVRLFGQTDYRSNNKVFGIKTLDRRRHMYILGKTGTGKSTMMQNMIIADIAEGKGVGVLDPHGDLIEEVLEMIPESRIADTVLFDPSDIEHPVGINLLKVADMSERDVVADGIVEVFKRQFGDSWGPRLQYILTNAILTLLECQNVSLLAVTRILIDANYRKFLLKQVKDPIIKNFWENEFAEMSRNPRLLTEALSPIQNKVGRFVSSPMIRNMIAQVNSSIKIDELMDQGKIILINLSQGKIGEENSTLLGGLFVTKIFSSAMQRASQSKENRRDFYLYVDEFQSFANNTFVKILSEARKYGLNLTVAHQYIDQISYEITDALFGNVGTMGVFTVGQKDAQKLEKEFAPYLDFEDIVNLQKYAFVCKLMIDQSQSKPFTAKSLPPLYKGDRARIEKVKQYTRDNFAMKRLDIEDKINKWSAQTYNSDGNLVSSSKDKGHKKGDK